MKFSVVVVFVFIALTATAQDPQKKFSEFFLDGDKVAAVDRQVSEVAISDEVLAKKLDAERKAVPLVALPETTWGALLGALETLKNTATAEDLLVNVVRIDQIEDLTAAGQGVDIAWRPFANALDAELSFTSGTLVEIRATKSGALYAQSHTRDSAAPDGRMETRRIGKIEAGELSKILEPLAKAQAEENGAPLLIKFSAYEDSLIRDLEPALMLLKSLQSPKYPMDLNSFHFSIIQP